MVAKKKSSVDGAAISVDKAKLAPKLSGRAIPVPEDQIGKRIKEAREALGLTQSALASRTKMLDPRSEGISRTVIVGYEAGTYRPGARELRILCETLHVTPNWLLFHSETPFEATQASSDFLREGDQFSTAIRLAFAAMLLMPHERGLVSSLILSLGGRELGDARLSALLGGVTWISNALRETIKERYSVEIDDVTLPDFLDAWARGGASNWGNKLKFGDDGEVVGGEWLYPDPETKKTN